MAQSEGNSQEKVSNNIGWEGRKNNDESKVCPEDFGGESSRNRDNRANPPKSLHK